jgi:hypothetical protein
MVLRVLDNFLKRVLPRASQRKLGRMSRDNEDIPSTLPVKTAWPFCPFNSVEGTWIVGTVVGSGFDWCRKTLYSQGIERRRLVLEVGFKV